MAPEFTSVSSSRPIGSWDRLGDGVFRLTRSVGTPRRGARALPNGQDTRERPGHSVDVPYDDHAVRVALRVVAVTAPGVLRGHGPIQTARKGSPSELPLTKRQRRVVEGTQMTIKFPFRSNRP